MARGGYTTFCFNLAMRCPIENSISNILMEFSAYFLKHISSQQIMKKYDVVKGYDVIRGRKVQRSLYLGLTVLCEDVIKGRGAGKTVSERDIDQKL